MRYAFPIVLDFVPVVPGLRSHGQPIFCDLALSPAVRGFVLDLPGLRSHGCPLLAFLYGVMRCDYFKQVTRLYGVTRCDCVVQ